VIGVLPSPTSPPATVPGVAEQLEDPMHALCVWLAAIVAYGVFLAWYQNWRGSLTRAEIDARMRRLETKGMGTPAERAVLRTFFEADDGREFLMLNLVRLHPEPVANPVTGELQEARKLLDGYSRTFLRALLRRGGHPAFLGVPVGGFVDTWGIDPGPGWNLVGMMRYRSRRDLIELITDDAFADAHVFKRAAMPVTCSFPMGRIRFLTGPRVVVALALALGAALAHCAIAG